MFLRCHIVQQDTEQPRGPVKIAPPDRMPRVRSDAGIKHMTNFGLLLEPVDELQSVALMALEAHLKRAQSAMHEVAIVRAHAVSPVTRRILQPPEDVRSEEHTSELQSLMRISYAVFCLKQKRKNKPHIPKH